MKPTLSKGAKNGKFINDNFDRISMIRAMNENAPLNVFIEHDFSRTIIGSRADKFSIHNADSNRIWHRWGNPQTLQLSKNDSQNAQPMRPCLNFSNQIAEDEPVSYRNLSP
ncbi:hypothetical protein HPP92_013665 [Vanilla planifolia]|uniref:Uncharacterized protein n=1 Tax=Vanilla planifolia TaxID=51239 RepID=A0A835V0U4_VANPL|nr:hypothetical protein HPP92_013665 [Vanilla planifolia]